MGEPALRGHPEVDIMRGVENTSGPLGQGHTFAVGAAIAAKFLKARFNEVMGQTIYAYISDGGIQEEISQGAGRIAGALGSGQPGHVLRLPTTSSFLPKRKM